MMVRRGLGTRPMGQNRQSTSADYSDEETRTFVNTMKALIDEFYRSDLAEKRLPPMTKEQRKIVHKLARDRDLRSFSKGKEGERYLTIARVKAYMYATVPVMNSQPIRLSNLQNDSIKKFLTDYPIDDMQVDEHYAHPGDRSKSKTNGSHLYSQMIVPPPSNPNVSGNITAFRRSLPAYKHRKEIIHAIDKYQVILITGGTGCGKTTQVPQFILEEATSHQRPIRVICTQPRRLPAIAVSERVAKERGEQIPGTIGYHIRLEQKCTSNTVLTYCTSGVLLRLLTVDAYASEFSHIILDEIHEREQNTDYLLIALKEALRRRKDLKVILMSATMEGNRETFLKYFNDSQIGVIDIPSRLHHVEKYFLAEILVMTNYMLANQQYALSQAAFPQISQWGNGNSRTPISSCHTAADPAQFSHYSSTMHPSASTPAFHVDPYDQIANQITSSVHGHNHAFTRQQSMYSDVPTYAPVNEQWNQLTYEQQNYISKNTMVNQIELPAAFRFHAFFNPEPTSCIYKNVETDLGNRPQHFVPDYGLRLKSTNYDRDGLVDCYNRYENRLYDEGIDHNLTVHLIKYLTDSPLEGSILVFLPGYDDILTVRDRLNEPPMNRNHHVIFVLHSQMNSADQQKVFEEVKGPGVRKVILSTNIAEASLTIDDVLFVIDCGKVKEKVYDHSTRINQLKVVWIAKSNAEQRSGRAGRVRNGYCFRLYSELEYESLNQTQVAEMKRAAIHDVCLHAKMFAPENMPVKNFLAMAPEPPDPEAIDSSFLFLQQLGALFPFTNVSPFDPNTEAPSYTRRGDIEPDITGLGAVIAHLPLDPQLARLLLFGIALQCFNPIISLVAALSHRDPFVLPMGEERAISLLSRDSLGRRDLSDHLMLVRALYGYLKVTERSRKEYCTRHYLSVPTMKMIDGIRRQLIFELRRLNLIPKSCRDCDDPLLNRYSHSWGMVQAAIVAGCYPFIGITRSGSKIKKIQTPIENAVLHPSSVVKRQLQMVGKPEMMQYSNDDCSEPIVEFMAYQELSRIDEGLTLRTVTATTALHTLLFSGSIITEKVFLQEFEICTEEFDDDQTAEAADYFQREHSVELDSFLAFRGTFETIKRVMKLRFKFMNYFMKWLRNPSIVLNAEDQKLLECLDLVLTDELKKCNFHEVKDLPKAQPVDFNDPRLRASFNSHNHRRQNHVNGNSSNGNARQFADFQNPITPSKPQKEATHAHQKVAKPASADFGKKRVAVDHNNPAFRMVTQTAKAAAEASGQCSNDKITSFIKAVENNSSKIPPTPIKAEVISQKEALPKPVVDAKPQVPKADSSATTISSSINTSKTTTVKVPSAKPSEAKKTSDPNGVNGTKQANGHGPTWQESFSNDVRNSNPEATLSNRHPRSARNGGEQYSRSQYHQHQNGSSYTRPQQNQNQAFNGHTRGRCFYNSSRIGSNKSHNLRHQKSFEKYKHRPESNENVNEKGEGSQPTSKPINQNWRSH